MKAESEDIKWMERALQLAALGLETTLPNPVVGCVIVKNGEIIAEGWHKKFGGPHAEVEALNSIPSLSKSELSDTTAYVTLEPCSHFGKTPPCADLLIKRGVGKVVTAMEDPNPAVSGRGHKRLIDAGIKVHSGVLTSQARKLNRQFIKLQTSSLPYITLKWAQSSDGFIDPETTPAQNRGSFPISSSDVNKETHKLRALNDAILIGRNTALVDNPRLTLRDEDGENPIRLILDPNLQLDPSSLNMVKEKGQTFFICSTQSKNQHSLALPLLTEENGIKGALTELRTRFNIHTVLVEGGTSTHQAFIDRNLWDEAWVVTADKLLNGGLKSPLLDCTPEIISLHENDKLSRYYNND